MSRLKILYRVLSVQSEIMRFVYIAVPSHFVELHTLLICSRQVVAISFVNFAYPDNFHIYAESKILGYFSRSIAKLREQRNFSCMQPTLEQ